MRTVTFSDAKVAALVNEHFISAWHNRSPGFCNDDFTTEESIFKSSAEAYTTRNICTFVMSPDGKVFSYVAGYLSPRLFLEFLETTLELRRAIFDDQMQIKPNGLEEAHRLHGKRAGEISKLALGKTKTCTFDDREYRGMRHVHGDNCAWVTRSTLTYLSRLHISWQLMKALPDFEEIRFKYLYGNRFSEEGTGATPIAWDPTMASRK